MKMEQKDGPNTPKNSVTVKGNSLERGGWTI